MEYGFSMGHNISFQQWNAVCQWDIIYCSSVCCNMFHEKLNMFSRKSLFRITKEPLSPCERAFMGVS